MGVKIRNGISRDACKLADNEKLKETMMMFGKPEFFSIEP